MNNWWQTWALVVAQTLAERWAKTQQQPSASQADQPQGGADRNELKSPKSESGETQEEAPVP